MKLRSFKLRITLLSVLLSGAVIFVFGGWAWSLNYRTSLNRVDQQITDLCQRHLSARQNPNYWEFVGESLGAVYGDKDAVVLLVRSRRQGEILYVSDNWPSDLPKDVFPEPSEFPVPPPGGMPPPPEGEALPLQPDLAPHPPGQPPDAAVPRQPVPLQPAPFQQPPFGPRGQGPRGPFAPPGAEPRFPGGGPQASGPLDGRGGPRGPRGRGGPPPLPVSLPALSTREGGGQEWRMAVVGNPEITMVLGLNLNRFNVEMRRARNAFLVAIPTALLLIAAGGWLLSQRALRPVRALTATAQRVTAKGLDQRIPKTQEDAEFMRLIGVFNDMLDRLEKSFKQAVRFSADAAHELKTPLTILQGELEQALHASPSGSTQQQTYNKLLEEVQRLKSIIRKLLLLSLADSGQLRLHLEPLNLSEALESVYEDTQIIAPHLNVKRDLAARVWVMADRDLLRQIVQNLTSNAIKYNRKEGKIEFYLRSDGSMVRFTIANSGKGIPKEERAKVFERFYRGDPSRNRRVEGVGLGLSLAREIARAHHGDLELENTAAGVVAFTLTLPVSAPADPL